MFDHATVVSGILVCIMHEIFFTTFEQNVKTQLYDDVLVLNVSSDLFKYDIYVAMILKRKLVLLNGICSCCFYLYSFTP